MKNLIAVLVASAIVLISACGASDSPSTVVKNFYMHLSAGEVNDAAGLITKDGIALLQQFGGASSFLSDQTKKINKKGGIKLYRTLNEEITGDTAKVSFELTYGNGDTKEDDEELIKEGGSWHISVSK